MYSRPRPIRPGDAVDGFNCGEPRLDRWIRERALRNESAGASRTFVSIGADQESVAGYYCLSASSIGIEDAPGQLRRNMPDPIPVILIGRLAVDHGHGGQGLGASHLQDAVLKAIDVAQTIGTRAILVHALSDSAQDFYTKFGFAMMPRTERTMFLLVRDAIATIERVAAQR